MSGIDYDYLHDSETRSTDYATGGQKGVKLTQVGALDPVALIEVGRVAGMGANKYSAFNYLQGFDWAHAYNAMQRHANLFWSGEDRDAESGLPHIAHAAWMALALVSFYLRGIGTDTRPPRLEQPAMPRTLEEAISPEGMKDWLDEFFGAVTYNGMDLSRSGGDRSAVIDVTDIVEAWGTGDGPVFEFGTLRAGDVTDGSV